MAINYTVQMIFDSVKIIPELSPIFNKMTSGSSLEPELSIANEVWGRMFETTTQWKYNETLLPPFYLNSYQQDYALVNSNGSSVTNVASLQSGDCVDINNTAQPKAQPQIEVVRQLPRSSSYNAVTNLFTPIKFQVCALPNSQLYYGIWGDANTGNATRGNNPQANTAITNPLGSGKSMPSNAITQIQDVNGNLLVLTTYGTTGSSAPVLPASSAAGTTVTDGSCVWTVVDSTAVGIRILPAPSQSGVVWQINLRGQGKPPVLFSNLDTLITPITDEWAYVFRSGCIAASYRYSADGKVSQKYPQMMQMWEAELMKARIASDKEPESFYLVPSSGLVAPIGGQMPTPANPFSWPWS